VMDMTPDLLHKIEPALTVYSGRQFIDPQVAPREALRALPGMSPDSVQAALVARDRQQAPASLLFGDALTSLRGRAFSIRTEFKMSNRTIVHDAAVRLTEDPNQPYWLLSWRSR
jgi:general secretion pathway protein K